MARTSKSKMTARKSRDPELTKQNFINAGESLFAEFGYHGTTLDMLAERAGANKALVSYYFGSKDGLYDAVITALVAQVVQTVRDKLSDSDDPVVQFRQYVSALAAAFAARPTFPAILMREYISGDLQAREIPFREVLQFYQMTEKLYRAGVRKKVFRKMDAHQLHLSIVAPLVHFVLTTRLRKTALSRYDTGLSDPAVDAFALNHADLLIDGMR